MVWIKKNFQATQGIDTYQLFAEQCSVSRDWCEMEHLQKIDFDQVIFRRRPYDADFPVYIAILLFVRKIRFLKSMEILCLTASALECWSSDRKWNLLMERETHDKLLERKFLPCFTIGKFSIVSSKFRWRNFVFFSYMEWSLNNHYDILKLCNRLKQMRKYTFAGAPMTIFVDL